jgi:hypothetical protein
LRRQPVYAEPQKPADDAPRPEPFVTSWIATFRRGIAQESREALALVRQLGLETPCARPTT